MSKVRPMPCEACPYRRDVPSGVWAKNEYDKLREYDQETMGQFDEQGRPLGAFHCHASPEALCNGWAVVHCNRGGEYEPLALRLWFKDVKIPEPVVPLFASGNEAADHGMADFEEPSSEAVQAQQRLMHKHPRLRERYDELSELEDADV